MSPYDEATGHDEGIEGWALALASAAAGDPDDLTAIGVAACAAGHAQTRVECIRCLPPGTHPMTFTAAVKHVRDVERLYRDVTDDGPNTAAHGPGDIQPATSGRGARASGRYL